jgi:signal transduction histidine kinase
VLDRAARKLTVEQRNSLKCLAKLAARLLEHAESVQTQRLAQQAQWKQEEEFLTAVSAVAVDLKSYVDRTYTYRYVNDAYLAFWKRRRDEIIGRSVESLLGKDLFQRTAKPALDRAFEGHVVSYDALVNYPAKGERHVRITYLPSGGEVGRPCKGVVVRVQDIHELKRHEIELEKTVQLLERKTIEQQRFIHIVSHDLREPLNSINNFISLLVQDHRAALPLEAQRYLDYVATGGTRMKRLLDDLVRFTELEHYTPELEAVDLNLVAVQVRDDLLSATRAAEAEIHIGELPVLQGNASFLRIALQNMVSNALKFRRPSVTPMVSISSVEVGCDVILRVDDNGLGISDEHQTEVFEAFKRLHNRRTYEGSGLGLAICKRIAQMHGGWLSVKSEPGVGSSFSLHLPSRVPNPSGDSLP